MNIFFEVWFQSEFSKYVFSGYFICTGFLTMSFGCFHCFCLECGAYWTVAIRNAPDLQCVDRDRV